MVPVKLSINISLVGLVGWLYSKHFWVKVPLNGGNVPTWPLAVDWDVKHQLKKIHVKHNVNAKSATAISTPGGPRGRVVKVADFSALDHSIISPMWVRASHGARIHM